MTLTSKGKLLYDRAISILDLVNKTKVEIKQNDIFGSIVIAAGESISFQYLAQACKLMQEKYQLVEFKIISGNEQSVCFNIENDLADIGLLIESPRINDFNYMKLPVQNYWGVLVGSQSPLYALKAITCQDLASQKLIISEQALQRNDLSAWFGDYKNHLNIVATYNLLYNAYSLLKAEVGIVLALDGIINPDPGYKFIPLTPKQNASSAIVWKKDGLKTTACKCFIDILKQYNFD